MMDMSEKSGATRRIELEESEAYEKQIRREY